MGKVINLAIICSAILLVISFSKRNDFPKEINLAPELSQEPKQNAIEQAPFTVNYRDVSYQVNPQYEYELYGLVVSYRHHSGDSMLHKSWNDHLNMTDICVIWGETAESAYLNQFDFWNGQFTCNYRTRSNVAWNSFNENQLSNNHLISNDDSIRKKIHAVKVGDQVRVMGFLSSYGEPNKPQRGTSTVRTDKGNGACETIFVNDFIILKESQNHWRSIMLICLISLILFLAGYFAAPFRAHK